MSEIYRLLTDGEIKEFGDEFYSPNGEGWKPIKNIGAPLKSNYSRPVRRKVEMYTQEEALQFFFWWWNQKGNNTEEGFQRWLELGKP